MKFAYSILLGEHVAAPDASYSDATAFQIVCPSCKDPVIKVERTVDEQPSHFFSHHRAVPGNSDCEMRVASIAPAVRAATDALGRGQSLKIFLSVFRDLLNLADWQREATAPASKRPGVRKLAALLETRFMKGQILQETATDELIEDHARFGDFEDLQRTTGLTMSFRRRLARDMIAHLRAPHAGKSRQAAMLFAAAQAVASHAGKPEAYANGGADLHAADRLMADEKGLNEWVANLVPGGLAHSELMALETFALRALTFALLTIPVRPILENARNGRHPLFGIEFMEIPNLMPYDPSSHERLSPQP